MTISVLAGRYLDNEFHRCEDKELTSFFHESDQSFHAPQAFHPITNRTFSQYMAMAPHFFKNIVDSIDPNFETFSIADIGCGSGMALGGFLAHYPQAKAVCVNKAGYRFHQSESPSEWAKKMIRMNIPLMCNAAGSLSHPEMVLMKKGITLEPIPLPTAGFDLVTSMFALDAGKLNETQGFEGVMEVLPLLKVGGFGLILPTFVLAPAFSAMNLPLHRIPHGSIVRSISLRTAAGAEFTLLFFVRESVTMGMVVRRCSDGFLATHPKEKWGCFTQPVVADKAFSSKFFAHQAIPANALDHGVHTEVVKLFDHILDFTLTHDSPNVRLKPAHVCAVPVTTIDTCHYYYHYMRHFFLKLHAASWIDVHDVPLL